MLQASEHSATDPEKGTSCLWVNPGADPGGRSRCGAASKFEPDFSCIAKHSREVPPIPRRRPLLPGCRAVSDFCRGTCLLLRMVSSNGGAVDQPARFIRPPCKFCWSVTFGINFHSVTHHTRADLLLFTICHFLYKV